MQYRASAGKYFIYYILAFYALVSVLSIYFFDGTGDPGDSVTHYLFARYAPYHVALYFDHWAKPLFVLLASPFAQFGFNGIKVFNALISGLVLFVSFKTAQALSLKNPILVCFLLLFSPLFYILTFSGLTEPLFALFTILGVYLCCKEKFLFSSLAISFLPYIRSEGLIIIGVFALYFLYKRKWTALALLSAGSVLYGIAGYFVHGNFLWVFTHIPYAKLSSVYGKGDLFHFVFELINVTGIPIYILFWIGLIASIIRLFKNKLNPEFDFLILAGFICFFVAHSLFWYLGIFNSMGLKRVLIGIMPLIALISLTGFNVLSENFLNQNIKIKKYVLAAIIIYVFAFPFFPNPSAIQWQKDMMLRDEQKVGDKVAKFVLANKKTMPYILFNHRYLSMPLKLDYFDNNSCYRISIQSIEKLNVGDIVIWDNLYSEFESGLIKTTLDSLPQLKSVAIFNSNEFGNTVVFAVYEKTN